MMSDIKIEGLEALLDALESIVDINKLENAVGKACALVERTAKQKAPKGNGELARSITSKTSRDGDNPVGVVFTPLEYAPYVEFGTGLFAENGDGRKEVPWVYIEGGSGGGSGKKTVYANEAEAIASAQYLRKTKGLDARVSYGKHPEPYMRPALNENREQITRILGEAITK